MCDCLTPSLVCKILTFLKLYLQNNKPRWDSSEIDVLILLYQEKKKLIKGNI